MHPELATLIGALNQHIIGKETQLKLAVTCLLANGHLLIEDLPGMGKTTLSHALAGVFGLQFSRIQFTSDLLPADIIGVSIFDKQQGFVFHPGPLFNNVVLADEINRASPKTQSALLEAMEESQVSVDSVTHDLPHPFFVIATQNPSHQAGTYPLPESQLDRFLMRISLGYPDWNAEKAMLSSSNINNRQPIESVLTPERLQLLQSKANQVHVSDAIINYILRLVNLSRTDTRYSQPLSPRASKALLMCSQAWALLHHRDYVIPEDIQAVFISVAEHRLRGTQTDVDQGTLLSKELLDNIDPLAA